MRLFLPGAIGTEDEKVGERRWLWVDHLVETRGSRGMDQINEESVAPRFVTGAGFDASQVGATETELGEGKGESPRSVGGDKHDCGLVIILVDLGRAFGEDEETSCVVITIHHVLAQNFQSMGRPGLGRSERRNLWVAIGSNLPNRACRVVSRYRPDTEPIQSGLSLGQRLRV